MPTAPGLCRFSQEATAAKTPKSGGRAGVSSSWPAPSCGAITTARNGSSPTICSKGRLQARADSSRLLRAGHLGQKTFRIRVPSGISPFAVSLHKNFDHPANRFLPVAANFEFQYIFTPGHRDVAKMLHFRLRKFQVD